ncbi:MAG: NACHT domain-containing protein, partial [Ignavibacteria bacterium]|nr:NACHT domain-containing protein [Ignavibacteria bacterium]
MKPKNARHFIDKFPDLLKFVGDYFKTNFEKNGQEIFDNSNGSLAILIKLLGKPVVDKYFEGLDQKVLENHGFKTYLEAAYLQANKSIDLLSEMVKLNVTTNEFRTIVENSLTEQIQELGNKNLISAFHPKNHPSVEFVRNSFKKLFQDLQIKSEVISIFESDFNKNIENTIKEKFGKKYEEHLLEMKNDIMEVSEYNFLVSLKDLGKIGFTEREDLKYMDAFGHWEEVRNYRRTDEEMYAVQSYMDLYKEIISIEKKLLSMEVLIEQYFKNSENNLNKILFIISDFGKGKSIFLKHYASKLATKYLQTNNGPFPVYFNLKNYNEFKGVGHRLGVIAEYLSYNGINIESEYYKKKEYVFLIDSLDESGELKSENINKIIEDIKLIQQLDRETCRTNKIIVTSRPIDEGLESQLKFHEPFEKKDKEGRKKSFFISLYGFKIDQFNAWLFNTLKEKNIELSNLSGYPLEIFTKIQSSTEVNFYEEFVTESILSYSELRRPIFAYMVYQLINNNIDFRKIGKIGIYLSFLNLLTKEAKYINDVSYDVNLLEEFKFRNILHSTAALWQYERVRGKSLTKVNICRTIESRNIQEREEDVLDRYKEIKDFQFFSHSYFGESGNNLTFQHQSFAEILLAEYYFKIILKYALDKPKELEKARLKLTLGIPTDQTIEFLDQLVTLFIDCITNTTVEVLEKRKLLAPLLASLATEDYCKDLFSNHIYPWFSEYFKKEALLIEIPKEALVNWCFERDDLYRILDFSIDMINSDDSLLITKSNSHSSLYDYEIISINKHLNSVTYNIDKWITLLIKNLISEKINIDNTSYSKVTNPYILFDLIKSWNYAFNRPSPNWAENCFKNIDLANSILTIDMSNFSLTALNFENSNLSNLILTNCDLERCNFNNVTFKNVDMKFTER